MRRQAPTRQAGASTAKRRPREVALSAEAVHLVERFGLVLERLDIRPIAARVFAVLLIADPPELTFDELRAALNASKSAISTALTYWLQREALEVVTRPGDRRRYFRVADRAWINVLQARTRVFAELREVLDEAATVTRNLASEQRLKRVSALYRELDETLGDVFLKWEQT